VSPGVFVVCAVFSRGDLPIFFKDSSGNPTSPYLVAYSLYQQGACGAVLVGCADRTPVEAAVGEYYVSGVAASPGQWFVEWTYQETSTSPLTGVIFAFTVFDPARYCPKCCGSPCLCPSGW